jgi:hypothetical protein
VLAFLQFYFLEILEETKPQVITLVLIYGVSCIQTSLQVDMRGLFVEELRGDYIRIQHNRGHILVVKENYENMAHTI